MLELVLLRRFGRENVGLRIWVVLVQERCRIESAADCRCGCKSSDSVSRTTVLVGYIRRSRIERTLYDH